MSSSALVHRVIETNVNSDLQNLPESPSQEPSTSSTGASEPPGGNVVREVSLPATPAERAKERKDLYERLRGVFIVHVLAPSEVRGQEYDIFIYLKRHKDKPISIVRKAEFFFGESWGNRIFEGKREGDVIGVRLSAYGTFLCTCQVTFEDGQQESLYRYIDFEMGKVVAGLPEEFEVRS